MPGLHFLVLGGARSGKSSYALALGSRWLIGDGSVDPQGLLIATARPGDWEMQQRIEAHKMDRGAAWQTVEEEYLLAETIEQAGSRFPVILVDCLTMWLSNAMLADANDIGQEIAALVQAVRGCTVPLVMVSNEVGMGLVPETPLGRRFRDLQGRLNQEVASACDTVVFMAAGLPLALKGELPL